MPKGCTVPLASEDRSTTRFGGADMGRMAAELTSTTILPDDDFDGKPVYRGCRAGPSGVVRPSVSSLGGEEGGRGVVKFERRGGGAPRAQSASSHSRKASAIRGSSRTP